MDKDATYIYHEEHEAYDEKSKIHHEVHEEHEGKTVSTLNSREE